MSPASAPRAGALRPAVIAGTGSFAPERVMTNQDLQAIVDTTDEWIVSRTGMKERRIAGPGTATSDLASEAARRALADAGLAAGDVEMIVVATITPDYPFPNTACVVQDKIGATKAFCMGLEAACSGFVYAVETARNFIAAGAVTNALVIGAEKMSSILDWQDRATCVLFGDGAGAVVLKAAAPGERGILTASLGSDGSLTDLLLVPAGGSRKPATGGTVAAREHFLRMSGKEVFKHAVTNMVRAAQTAIARAGLQVADIDWIIPHQANLRIISAIAERLGMPAEKCIVNVQTYGNTSGASIGLALDEAVRDGRIRKGQKVLFVAFGGGFTWGAMVLEWAKGAEG
ncbi:MAG: ketoacyl-ACP synthase III [Lentisphaerae bacterium]|nr:ketoacyl-ACP synthase III [Lentisphaerota bacterium]